MLRLFGSAEAAKETAKPEQKIEADTNKNLKKNFLSSVKILPKEAKSTIKKYFENKKQNAEQDIFAKMKSIIGADQPVEDPLKAYNSPIKHMERICILAPNQNAALPPADVWKILAFMFMQPIDPKSLEYELFGEIAGQALDRIFKQKDTLLELCNLYCYFEFKEDKFDQASRILFNPNKESIVADLAEFSCCKRAKPLYESKLAGAARAAKNALKEFQDFTNSLVLEEDENERRVVSVRAKQGGQ